MHVLFVEFEQIPLLMLKPFLQVVHEVRFWHETQVDGHLMHHPEESGKYVDGHTVTQVVMLSVTL